ncbi:MAG TPA: hypoxanthine-guanine phosphoribosyltransferase [Arenimonas sp.]|nr:hypoxanthine-guanine phosphoribosyltransferase [Arenimonas sp.]
MSHELSTALSKSRVIFDRAAIESAIRRMAGEIRADYSGERPVYLTIMHGGMLFAAQLALELGIDLEFDYLHATRYRGETRGTDLVWLHRPVTPLAGRKVLLADDILDEGHTLKAVRDWCVTEGASEVKIAVMTRKLHDRCAEGIRADYIGLDLPDYYVYGFGMDYHEQGRNLPAIYAYEG